VPERPTVTGSRRILAAMDFDPWDDDPDLSSPSPSTGLDAARQVELAASLRGGDGSCDGTLAGTRRWAAQAGVTWPPLERALRGGGVACDCDVLNVLLHDETDLP
jgi:Protein of unknown function (DUF2695)